MLSLLRRSSLLLLGGLAAFSTASCSHRSSSRQHHVSLEQSLDEWVLWRDPNQASPNHDEQVLLDDYDWHLDSVLDDTGLNHTYGPWIDQVRSWAGMSGAFTLLVAQDFRYSDALVDEAGASAGNSLIVLDGKLLDILLEYSTFLARWERGDTRRTPVAALDEIVFLHNEVLGPTTEGIIDSYWNVSSRVADRAEVHFLRFLGALVYHEFGHLFLWHVLDEVRRHGDFSFPQHTHELDEEDADLVSGMLVAKAGLDLFSAEEVLDIQTFQYLQTFDRNLYYDEVLGFYQDSKVDDSHAPLSVRKSIVHEGYDRFLIAHEH